MKQIRILLVDDDNDWRATCTACLHRESDLMVIAETDSKSLTVRMVRDLQIDIALIGIPLPGSKEDARTIREIASVIGAKWVMLAGHFEGEVVCEAYSAGAVDYIVKSDFGRMSAIIRDAYHDRSPIRAEVAGYVREEIRRLKALERAYQVDKMKSQLTPTELAILQLIASGHTQKEIAGIMSVAIKTVKNHVNNILRKTGEKSSKRVAEKAKDLNILCCAEDNSVTSVTRFNLKRKSRHYKPGRL